MARVEWLDPQMIALEDRETKVTSDPTDPARSGHAEAEDRPRCDRCGEPMVLWAEIAKLGDQPEYRIYHCVPCDRIDWVAS
jgi:DNA-directed RNA polymerase subunit M/transcription elongation factor TFIIS